MTYLVRWRMIAILSVGRVEAAADDPAAVRAAAARIDWTLRRTPRDQGESRNPGFRIWYEGPLCVFYHIDEAEMRVDVLFAAPARRHR